MEKNKKDETEADAARPGRVLVSSAMKKKRPSLSLSLSLSLSPFVLSLIFFIFLIPLFIFVDFCWSFFPSFCFLLLAFRPPPVLSSIQASFTVVVYPEILSVILCGIFDNFSLSSFSSWNSFWIRKKKFSLYFFVSFLFSPFILNFKREILMTLPHLSLHVDRVGLDVLLSSVHLISSRFISVPHLSRPIITAFPPPNIFFFLNFRILFSFFFI